MTSEKYYKSIFELLINDQIRIKNQYKTRKIRKLDALFNNFDVYDETRHKQGKTKNKRYRITDEDYNQWQVLNKEDCTWSDLTLDTIDLYVIINQKGTNNCHKIMKVFAEGDLHLKLYYITKSTFDEINKMIMEVKIV
jgi:hypothetical protein